YGSGVAGGVRAVEQLRQVFAELRTVTVRDAVTIAQVDERIDGAGRVSATPGCTATLERMLDDLAWWGALLRDARRRDRRRRPDSAGGGDGTGSRDRAEDVGIRRSA